MLVPDEVWVAIPGYESKYQVSDAGRVRSMDHWDGRRNVKGRVLRPGSTKSGHVSVSLGRSNSKLVHGLVMLAFVGPRPQGMEVLHQNHIPWDNRKSNLRYGTRSENLAMDHAVGVRKASQAFINSANGKRHK